MKEKKPFWQSANFWHNLLTLLATIFVSAEAQQLLTTAHSIVDQAFAQPIQITAIITASFTFLNMVYQLFIKPKTTPADVAQVVEQVLQKKGITPPPDTTGQTA